jgi:hypothetical protein
MIVEKNNSAETTCCLAEKKVERKCDADACMSAENCAY